MRIRTRRPPCIARVVSGLLRTVPFCAPLALGAPAALSQPGSSATLLVEIPAQPLAQALSALASQTGLQMVYVSGLVRNQRSQRVAAGIPVREALTQLLQGTGLQFHTDRPQRADSCSRCGPSPPRPQTRMSSLK